MDIQIEKQVRVHVGTMRDRQSAYKVLATAEGFERLQRRHGFKQLEEALLSCLNPISTNAARQFTTFIDHDVKATVDMDGSMILVDATTPWE